MINVNRLTPFFTSVKNFKIKTASQKWIELVCKVLLDFTPLASGYSLSCYISEHSELFGQDKP